MRDSIASGGQQVYQAFLSNNPQVSPISRNAKPIYQHSLKVTQPTTVGVGPAKNHGKNATPVRGGLSGGIRLEFDYFQGKL